MRRGEATQYLSIGTTVLTWEGIGRYILKARIVPLSRMLSAPSLIKSVSDSNGLSWCFVATGPYTVPLSAVAPVCSRMTSPSNVVRLQLDSRGYLDIKHNSFRPVGHDGAGPMIEGESNYRYRFSRCGINRYVTAHLAKFVAGTRTWVEARSPLRGWNCHWPKHGPAGKAVCPFGVDPGQVAVTHPIVVSRTRAVQPATSRVQRLPETCSV